MFTQWIPTIMTCLIDSLCGNGLLRLQFKVATSQGCVQLLCVTFCLQIYFMCSSEVCMPKEKTCVERCFDGRVSLQTSQIAVAYYFKTLSFVCILCLLPESIRSWSSRPEKNLGGGKNKGFFYFNTVMGVFLTLLWI